jgi:predicted permease
VRNLKLAIRSLTKSPGFTVIAVLTLALGIGVNVAIFSIIDAVMLRPLPYPEPQHLFAMWETLTGDPPANWNTSNAANPRERMTISIANFADYTRGIRGAELASYQAISMNLTGAGNPERVAGERVSSNYFSVLGVAPAQGRGFLANEDRAGADRVIVVSHEFWERRLGLNSDWASQSVALDGEKYRIVGIMPQGFRSPAAIERGERFEFFVPGAYASSVLADRGSHQIWAIARIGREATAQAVQAQLDALSSRLANQFPESNRNIKTIMTPLADDLIRNARTSLLVILGAVGLVLLIACANLANLLLARAVTRQREITIRFALGASRWRIIGELLTQSLTLSLLGSLAGLALGVWTRTVLVKLAPAGIPRLASAEFDVRVLIFTILLACVTGFAFGLFPALQVSKAGPAASLKSNERALAGRGVMRWRTALMVAEISLSMMLLVGAGLLVRSFIRLNQVDLGFNTERVLAMRIVLPDKSYSADRRLAFFEDLADRVSALPGVQSVAFANRMPMRGGWTTSMSMDDNTQPDIDAQVVSPGYFQTVGIPLIQGRLLAAADRNGAPLVAVVNREFVRKYSANRPAIGRTLRFESHSPWITIVGIVGDIHRGGKSAEVLPEIYFPAAKGSALPVPLSDFAFRASGDPKRLLAAVQQQVWAIDKDQPLTNVRTLEEIVTQAGAERRFQTLLLAAFAALALLLALVGVYGVISYAVSQRTREIGLRMALGAARADVVRSIVVRSMSTVAIGIAAGAMGALMLSRLLRSFLFEIDPADPLTYGAIAALLAMAAFIACCVPALRASRVDPMIALRYE